MLNKNHVKHAFLYIITAVIALSSTGCSNKTDQATNVQVKNDIAGFLLHFDQREETRRLTALVEKKRLPVKVVWYYPDNSSKDSPSNRESITEEDIDVDIESSLEQDIEQGIQAGAEPGGRTDIEENIEADIEAGIESVAESAGFGEIYERTSENISESISESSSESSYDNASDQSVVASETDLLSEAAALQEEAEEAVTEGAVQLTETGEYVTEDPGKINEIIEAFNGIIIVGNGHSRIVDSYCMVTFTLPDGSESTFNFVSPTLLRIGDQTYTLETDGSLWPALSLGN